MKPSKTSMQVVLEGCWKSLMGGGDEVAVITYVTGHVAGNPEPVLRVRVHQGLTNFNPYLYPFVPYP